MIEPAFNGTALGEPLKTHRIGSPWTLYIAEAPHCQHTITNSVSVFFHISSPTPPTIVNNFVNWPRKDTLSVHFVFSFKLFVAYQCEGESYQLQIAVSLYTQVLYSTFVHPNNTPMLLETGISSCCRPMSDYWRIYCVIKEVNIVN